MHNDTHTLWDIVVIGGGPAGMMAAGTAAERGARVLLIEKNDTLGKKLLLTGGGRCNITNLQPSVRAFLDALKESGKFLFSAFAQWNMEDTVAFFNAHGVPTKIEEGNRVFPVSDKAQSVLDALIRYMNKHGVTIRHASVAGFIVHDGRIAAVRCANGETIYARAFILATGGKSRPETGSTGDGFAWLAEIGHTVIAPNPSLVPVAIKDAWVKQLQGITLPAVGITLIHDGKKVERKEGKILFTHFGISGPTVLNMSKMIGDHLKKGPVTLSLDLFPSLDEQALNEKLLALFTEHSRKKFGNCLDALLPAAVAATIAAQSDISPDALCHAITREERNALAHLLKNIPMEVSRLLGADKAIITSGGIALEEVDFATMRSRLYPNLYCAGDILNIDRPSGGYSLQICWTTGFVAGTSAASVEK